MAFGIVVELHEPHIKVLSVHSWLAGGSRCAFWCGAKIILLPVRGLVYEFAQLRAEVFQVSDLRVFGVGLVLKVEIKAIHDSITERSLETLGTGLLRAKHLSNLHRTLLGGLFRTEAILE